jgi:hypothetical protein
MGATDSSASIGAHKNLCIYTNHTPDVSDTACGDHQTCCQYAAQWTNRYLDATAYGILSFIHVDLRESLTISSKKNYHWPNAWLNIHWCIILRHYWSYWYCSLCTKDMNSLCSLTIYDVIYKYSIIYTHNCMNLLKN